MLIYCVSIYGNINSKSSYWHQWKMVNEGRWWCLSLWPLLWFVFFQGNKVPYPLMVEVMAKISVNEITSDIDNFSLTFWCICFSDIHISAKAMRIFPWFQKAMYREHFVLNKSLSYNQFYSFPGELNLLLVIFFCQCRSYSQWQEQWQIYSNETIQVGRGVQMQLNYSSSLK